MVANLPPILLSLIYGAEIAGHCGLAYRITAAPLAIVALPLGAIFTSVATRSTDLNAVHALARKVLMVNVLSVAAPMLLIGLAAPYLAGSALGPQWALTGKIVAAFALLGAAQTLAAPFSEVTSIYRQQGARFLIDTVSASLVLLPIGIGAVCHWEPLTTIWAMSAGGAAGALAGLTIVYGFLRSMAQNDAFS
jgi:O-antigen/teichoic acid export membrane protein